MERSVEKPLRDLQAVWEEAGQSDPYFAVCSDPARRDRQWEPGAFFRSGESEIRAVLRYLRGLSGIDRPSGAALDFGCGIGRLTRALAGMFDEAVGVDIAPAMVNRARQIHTDLPNVRFEQNSRPDLKLFPDDRFGFAYSNIVLQHMRPSLALGYVRELLRVTRPGGLVVFQLPSEYRISKLGRIRRAVRIRTRLRAVLNYGEREGAVPWEMHAVPSAEVRRVVGDAGGRVIKMAWTNATDPAFNGELFFLSKPPALGWVSCQYTVQVPPAPDSAAHPQ